MIAAALEIVERSDRQIVERLRIELAPIVGRQLADVASRLSELLAEIGRLRSAALREAITVLRRGMLRLALDQPEAEAALLREALGDAEAEIAEIDDRAIKEALAAAVFALRPDRAATIREAAEMIRRADLASLRQAILAGILAGDSLDRLMERIAGTRRRRFTDGAMAQARRGLAAIGEGALMAAIVIGQDAFWGANGGRFGVLLRWTTMLDDRVCPTCRGLSGRFDAVGGSVPAELPRLTPSGLRPPAHVRCRCVMLAFLPGEIPDLPDYSDWLKTQSAAVQDDVLGKRKAALFRAGRTRLAGYVDRRGNELTLDELRG